MTVTRDGEKRVWDLGKRDRGGGFSCSSQGLWERIKKKPSEGYHQVFQVGDGLKVYDCLDYPLCHVNLLLGIRSAGAS